MTWRNVELQLPDGWYLLEDTEERLRIANRDLPDDLLATLPNVGEVPGPPPRAPEVADAAAAYLDAVVMTFTHQPDALPDDWRRWVEASGGTIESDLPMVLEGDVPATRIVYRRDVADTSTREMLVAIPSRSVVLVAGPAVPTGERAASTSPGPTEPTSPGPTEPTSPGPTEPTSPDPTEPTTSGTADATELFLAHVERFLDVLRSARFGAPLE